MKKTAIRAYTDELDTAEQVRDIAGKSAAIFLILQIHNPTR